VKYFITNQEEDRRMRRAAAVEWTLAGVLFLLVAAALANILHVLCTTNKQLRQLGIVRRPS
jgi:hypothetical protein